MAREDLIQLRRDAATRWTSVNPTLASGEMGVETDTGRAKFGNGTTAWVDLPYFNHPTSLVDDMIDAAVAAATAAAASSAAAAAVSAQQAAALAGPGYGINIADAIEHTASWDVVEADLGILHILSPGSGVTMQVKLPAASSYVGQCISLMVPASVSGLVQVITTPAQATSVVSDYSSDTFYMWHKEQVTLRASSSRWEILDWRKNPIYLDAANSTASNIALSTVGAGVEVSDWIAPSWDATYLRHYKFALDGASPQRVVLPRRGVYMIEFDAFVSWSGTAPTALYADIPGTGSGINNRHYADFIQRTSETQALIRLRRTLQNNGATQLAPSVYCTGGTSPIIQATSAACRIRLTELA